MRLPLPDGIPLQMVAVEDIGAVAAAVLIAPCRVPGGAVEIAGDELTGSQIAATFGRQAGLPARFESLPLEAAGDDDLRAMFTWFAKPPCLSSRSCRSPPNSTRKCKPSNNGWRGIGLRSTPGRPRPGNRPIPTNLLTNDEPQALKLRPVRLRQW